MAILRRRGQALTTRRGSAPGEMRGPGRKGIPNRKTILRLAALENAVKGEGILPLQFMLNLMRCKAPAGLKGKDKAAFFSMQLDAAKAAAPYCHRRQTEGETPPPEDVAAQVREQIKAMKEATRAKRS